MEQTSLKQLINEMQDLKKTKIFNNSLKAIDECIDLAYAKLEMEKEQITAFEGIATSKHIYLTGCNQFGVQQKIDESRLTVTGEGISAEEVTGEQNGCDYREHP